MSTILHSNVHKSKPANIPGELCKATTDYNQQGPDPQETITHKGWLLPTFPKGKLPPPPRRNWLPHQYFTFVGKRLPAWIPAPKTYREGLNLSVIWSFSPRTGSSQGKKIREGKGKLSRKHNTKFGRWTHLVTATDSTPQESRARDQALIKRTLGEVGPAVGPTLQFHFLELRLGQTE